MPVNWRIWPESTAFWIRSIAFVNDASSTFMNFVYQPAIAAQIAAYINYVSPVKGAKEAMEKIDPELAANRLVFPDDDTLSKVSIFDSKALQNKDYIERWQALIGS